MFIHAGRFVQDLNAWTGFEIGHLHVPDAFVQISSIMPQKRNPVPVEHLRLMASLGAARCEAVLTAVHNTPFTDMNDSEGEVQIAGYEAFDTAHRMMALLGGLLAAVTIDSAKVRRHIDEAGITLAELADSLVRTEAISFRQAHEVASKLARRMIDGGMTLSKVPFTAFQEIFAAAIGRPARLSEADFRRFTTPEHFIAVRTMHGGPAPAPLAASFARYRAEIADEAQARSTRSPRASAPRKPCWRAKSPAASRRWFALVLISRTHGATGIERADASGSARSRPCAASTSTSRTRNSSCWWGRRAAASRPSCA